MLWKVFYLFLFLGEHHPYYRKSWHDFQERATQVQDKNHERAGQQRSSDLPVSHRWWSRHRNQFLYERESLPTIDVTRIKACVQFEFEYRCECIFQWESAYYCTDWVLVGLVTFDCVYPRPISPLLWWAVSRRWRWAIRPWGPGNTRGESFKVRRNRAVK